ncbi:hypothetical protein [Streptomyces sp. NBC_01794]|uniref:hypothetical protein n=1 Tax=Streptomyces sp. NBC_01794 TaxID=2975942 RepID=UPI0030888B35|nr:hypothetical protein OIE54_10875 [Streptomyces sp. NBC_01794]
MPLLFLNEMSCGTGCEPVRAERAMTEFARTTRAVARVDKASTTLVSAVPLKSLEIADGYPIAKWVGNPRNRDAWQLLRQMQSKSPFKVVFPDEEDPFDIEYRHEGGPAEGLGAAHLMGGLAVSLPVAPCWDAPRLLLEREHLVESDDGDLDSRISEVDVRHASVPDHVEDHLPWIRERAEWLRRAGLAEVHNGARLWETRAELFPRVRFLPRVERQLNELETVSVPVVLRHLAELDKAVSEWDPQARPEGPLWPGSVRPEHQNRRDKFCWFEDLDGTQQVFELHVNFPPKPGRVHFRLVPDTKVVHVAHVGRKLGV